jgi:hypothetical protein
MIEAQIMAFGRKPIMLAERNHLIITVVGTS